MNKLRPKQSKIDPCTWLYCTMYVKAADNCNSRSINCNYEKSFGNEISAIHVHVYEQKRDSA